MPDLFFSYRRSDLARAKPLLNAMVLAGLTVWRDEQSIPEGAPLTREIREGLAACKALLAFYSHSYPESNVCRQELTLAYVAAQRTGESPHSRVLIVNPENAFDHLPPLLRDHKAFLFTVEQSDETVRRILDHVNALDGTLAAALNPLPRFYGVTAVEASRFVGRDHEMWDLHGKLTADRIGMVSTVHGQCLAQVRGLGGNGKTLLAREYAIRYGAAYPGGVYWVSAFGTDNSVIDLKTTSRESLRLDQIRQFAISKGVPIDGATSEQVEARFWNHLSELGEPCLWVVDDLPLALTSSELEKWCAHSGRTSTLVTIRTREHESLGTCLDLNGLKPDEAVALLRRHRLPDSPGEHQAARKIAELLGNHPLALDVAGSYLAKGIQTFQAYVNDLELSDRDVLEVAAELRAILPTGHERSISRTLLKSIEALNSAGLQLFRIASLLAPAPIPITILRDVFRTGQIASTDGDNTFGDALDQGDTLGLFEPAGVEARSVHTLISRVLRFRGSSDFNPDELRRSIFGTLLTRLQTLADIREHRNVSHEVVHARYLLAGPIHDQDEAKVALWLARYDFDRGDYAGARELQQRILEIYRRLFGENHPDTVTAMNNLATTLNAVGALAEARQLLEAAAVLHRRVHGSNHPDTPMTLSNLAGVLFAQGDLAGARSLQEQAVKEIGRLLGNRHNNTLTVMLNLSLTVQAQGDLPGARRVQEFVLNERRRSLGNDHPDTLAALGDLATTLALQGHLSEALQFKEEVLENTRKRWGDDHPDTLHVMFNMASTLLDQGDLIGARKINERLLEAYQRLLGDKHPDTLGAMNNLASTMQEQGDLNGARVILERLVEVRNTVSGNEHPDTLSAKNNLALTFLQQGDYVGARKLYLVVLDALVRRLGPTHQKTLTTKGSLAYTRYKEGQLTEACALQREVLAETIRLLGDTHSDTLRAMNNLALMMKDLGQLAEAQALDETVWARTRSLLGPEHPATLSALNNLGDGLKRQGNLRGAVSLYEQLVASRIAVLGLRHPETLVAKNNLAAALHSQGHYKQASLLGKEVLEGSRQVLGNQHPHTIKAMENLAEMLQAMGHTAEATVLRREATVMRSRPS